MYVALRGFDWIVKDYARCLEFWLGCTIWAHYATIKIIESIAQFYCAGTSTAPCEVMIVNWLSFLASSKEQIFHLLT